MNEELQRQIAGALQKMIDGSPAAWQELCRQASTTASIKLVLMLLAFTIVPTVMVLLARGAHKRAPGEDSSMVWAAVAGVSVFGTLMIGGLALGPLFDAWLSPGLHVLTLVR